MFIFNVKVRKKLKFFPSRSAVVGGFHVETLIIYKLGFNQNYYTFALILLTKIVMCSKFP